LRILATEEQEQEEELFEGIAVCGTNLSAVVDTSPYINEIHYKVGNRLYIENADQRTIRKARRREDIELENIVGNLMIAQYQVDRLRSRLSDRITGLGSATTKKDLHIHSNMVTDGIKLRSN
jgi:hypothetical protein